MRHGPRRRGAVTLATCLHLQYAATSLGTAESFVRSWDWSLKGLVPRNDRRHSAEHVQQGSAIV